MAAAPYVQGPGCLWWSNDGRINPAVVRGINVEQEQKLIDLKKFIKGSLDMPIDSVIIGKELAAEIGAHIGDEVTIYAPGNIQGVVQEIRREADDPKAKPKTLADLKDDVVIPAPLKVVGLINSGTNTFDSTFLLVTLEKAQELYSLKDGVHGIAVKTNDPYYVQPIQARIDDVIGSDGFAVS